MLTTHYLEEADALASRIAVIRSGLVIADGSPAEIKSRVAARKITCRTRLANAELLLLRGVQSVEMRDAVAEVLSVTPEETVRQLLDSDRSLSDLEVTGASLEEAFLAMTREEEVAA